MDIINKKIICCGLKDSASFFIYNICKNKTKINDNDEYVIYYANDYDFYLLFIKNIFNNQKLFLTLNSLSKENYVHYVFTDSGTDEFIINHLERKMDFSNFDYSIMYNPGEFISDNNPYSIYEYKNLKYFFSSSKTIDDSKWFQWEYKNLDKFFFDINYGLLFGAIKVGFNFTNDYYLNINTERLNKVFVYTKAQDRIGRINSVKEFENIDRFHKKAFNENDYFHFEANPASIHFSNPLDYNKCKFNLVLETLDYTYDMVYFLSEKTTKGLMYSTPFYVNANDFLVKELKNKGYYTLNEEFEGINYENYKNFCRFMKNCSDGEFDNLYNLAIKKAKNNKNKLFDYIYSDKVNEINLLINK